jgi:hypothetical protein
MDIHILHILTAHPFMRPLPNFTQSTDKKPHPREPLRTQLSTHRSLSLYDTSRRPTQPPKKHPPNHLDNRLPSTYQHTAAHVVVANQLISHTTTTATTVSKMCYPSCTRVDRDEDETPRQRSARQARERRATGNGNRARGQRRGDIELVTMPRRTYRVPGAYDSE